MSQKSKVRQAKKEAQQEKQAKTVINWIFGILIVLAIITMIYYAMNM